MTPEPSYEQMVAEIFSAPERMLQLEAGEVLLEQGQANMRLFCVRSGQLAGYAQDEAAVEQKTKLLVEADDLVGIQSFFSPEISSMMTVTAVVPSTVNYVTLKSLAQERDQPPEGLLLPLLTHALARRQKITFQLMRKDEEIDRINLLGQFSAAVAHELNNALAVIARGAHWMTAALDHEMAALSSAEYLVFQAGMRGRRIGSRDARHGGKKLERELKITSAEARKIAGMGLSEAQLTELRGQLRAAPGRFVQLWEFGATFCDLRHAAEHAGGVVESMRNLGARATVQHAAVSLEETLRSALTVSGSATRGVHIQLELPEEDFQLRANKGELVQVWTNLIRNACDAMRSLPEGTQKTLQIRAQQVHRCVRVSIQDNGGGISEDVLPRIFLPNFTTKRDGLNFGLGLGLSIVHRIVTGYEGNVVAENLAAGACFSVSLPTISQT